MTGGAASPTHNTKSPRLYSPPVESVPPGEIYAVLTLPDYSTWERPYIAINIVGTVDRRATIDGKASSSLDASLLVDAVIEALARSRVRMRIMIPHAEYGAVSGLYGKAEIHAREDTAEGPELDVTLPKPYAHRYAHYRTA